MNNDYKGEDGYVIAAAGFGKTESICELLSNYPSNYRVLILTHTNAGVNSIKKRCKKFKIVCKYNIQTIASFCLLYVKNFPKLAEYIKSDDYNDLYKSMMKLIENKIIQCIISKSYDELIIDEYQDCNEFHNFIIEQINKLIPAKFLGDPLQAIYDFDGKLVDFNILYNTKKELFKLETPWRWKNNLELGNWLSDCRLKLINGQKINYSIKPACVQTFNYSNIPEFCHIGYEFMKLKGKNVILFKDDYVALSVAKYFKGIFQIQEEIECKSIIKLLKYFDNNDVDKFLQELFALIKKCFINSSTEFKTIIDKILKKDYNFSRITKNKKITNCIIEIINDFNSKNVVLLLEEINQNTNIINYRKELWNVLKRVMNLKYQYLDRSTIDILKSIRNNEILNSSNNLISRILLVKGLAFDNVMVVIDKNAKTTITEKLFYVAITRAIKNLWIVVEKEKYVTK